MPTVRTRERNRNPHGWRIEEPRDSSVNSRFSKLRSRIRAAYQKAERLGVAFEAVYKKPSPEPRRPRTRTIFRYEPTKQRLVVESDAERWLDWGGTKEVLTDWARIETADGLSWIIERPRVRKAGYPRPKHPGLGGQSMTGALFGAEQWARTIAASPECATERLDASSVAQVLAALREATKLHAEGREFIGSLNVLAQRYLTRVGSVDSTRDGLKGHGGRTVLDRPAAVEHLAHYWFNLLPHREVEDLDERERLGLAEGFIDDIRRGTFYAKFAAYLPALAEAGLKEARQIATVHAKASEDVIALRYEKLCQRCAPGKGGLGKDRRHHYAEPMPWDEGWGCEHPSECTANLRDIHDAAWEHGKSIVRRAAAILGMTANGSRSLFDFERVAWDRSHGKRTTAKPAPQR